MENEAKNEAIENYLIQFQVKYPHLSLLLANETAKETLCKSVDCKNGIGEEEKKKLNQIILLSIFAINDRRQNYERAFGKFLQAYFCDRQVHFYLMRKMPLFAELNASLSTKNQKRFARARKREKMLDVLLAIFSLGTSAICNGPPKKELNKKISDPFFNEIIKLLLESGVL